MTTAPFITVSKGGPTEDIADGVYIVTLVDIKGPKTVTARRGVNAGKDVELLDWEFAVDDGGPMAGYMISASSSTASGPKSKLYAFLTALFGGQAPAVGMSFEKPNLVGRRALATIQHDDGGYPIIANLGALPPHLYAPGPVVGVQAPAVPTDQSAMVHRAPAQGAPAVDAPRFNAQGQIPGSGPQTARQQVAGAPQGDLPF